jgi:hypothetical protein
MRAKENFRVGSFKGLKKGIMNLDLGESLLYKTSNSIQISEMV